MQVMEDTQAINWEIEEEEETERPSEALGRGLEPVGRLHIFSSAHGPEKDFPLYLGKNMVGRMPDCSVTLPFSSISKQHAVIEILAWDKAPVLQDCGSLNGTQVLRPPKVLSPGVSHRLRDQELILFADLPCQYHRLNVPLPFVSRGPLTVEETPRVQGGTQPQGLLLAEDSEEEVDSPSERCVVKEPRTSPLAAVVPESDEEGPSPAPDGPGPPFAFNLDSDTDEEESQHSAAGEASLSARRGSTAETEQLKAMTPATQLGKDQCSVKERNNNTKVERDARNGVVSLGGILERNQSAGEDSDTDVDESRPPVRPAEVHLERAQPSDFIDSDTDVEEERIPATPAVVPMKKRQIFHRVSTKSLQEPALVHLQEIPAGNDTDVEESEIQLAVPLERNQISMVIDSNTDDEEEVLAALTLARLKESGSDTWNRGTDVEEDRAQPVALLEPSQTSAGRDSKTDMEEEGLPMENRRTVPKCHTDKACSEKRQFPLQDSDLEVDEDKSLLEVHLERNQASATIDITQVEEKVLPGPAIILVEKHQVPVVWTDQTYVEVEGGQAKLPVMHLGEPQPPLSEDCGTDVEEDTSLAASLVADTGKHQLLAEGDAGTESAAPVLEQERVLEARAQGVSLVSQVEQDLLPVSKENLIDLVVDTGTSGETIQPQKEGAQTPTERKREPHVDRTKNCGDNHGDSEDLDLQATQCFVERENQSPEVQSMEDEATQAFLATLPQESGPSYYSFQASGHLTCKAPPAEKASVGDQESADAHLPAAVPEASTPHHNPLLSQSQKHPVSQPFLSSSPSSLEPIPRTRQNGNQEVPGTPLSSEMEPLYPKSKVRLRGSSRKTLSAISSLALEPHSTIPTDQPLCPEPTSRVTRGRTRRSSLKTPELLVPEVQPSTSKDQSVTAEPISQGRTRKSVKAPEPVVSTATQSRALRSSVKTPKVDISTTPALQPSTSKDQPVTPEPTSQVTWGRTRRSSVKIPEPTVPTAPALQPSTSEDQSVITEHTSGGTHRRTRRSSVKTPEPIVPTAPEFQPTIPRDQPVTPEPTSQVTWGRTRRSSVKTPEPTVPTAPELQPSTSKDQSVITEPTSGATHSRTHRSSLKTPKPTVPTATELQPTTHKGQPVTPKRISQGRTPKSSSKTNTSVVSTVPELQACTPTDQPVIPKLAFQATRGRTQRFSIETPEPVAPTVPEPQPSISTDQPVTPEPTSRATRGRTHRSFVKMPQPIEPTAPDLESVTPTDQLFSPKVQGSQGKMLRSSTISAVPVLTTPEFQPSVPTDQPIPPEPISQANCSRRLRATRNHESLIAPIICEPYSALPEPKSRSSRNQRQRAVRTVESLRTIPKPAFAQLPEAPTHATQIHKLEAAGRSEFTLGPPPKASQSHKRPLATVDSPPPQKRHQRGEVTQETVFLKEEEEDPMERPREEEDVVVPGPGKRKRDQAEEEPKRIPSRSLRRTKPNQESTVPKVLFTGVVDARGERAVLALGGSLASSVAEASHLVTDRVRRTVKFLCALGRGIPILSLDWLHQSHKAGCFLPPDEYVVTDPEQEKNFGFSLRDALSRAREQRLLEGYEIHVTPGVQPPPPQMGEIISCCGGTVLPSMPRSYKPQRVVITCSQDFPRCSIPFRIGLPILSPEFLLTGVLKQEAKPEAFIFSTLEMSSS
ncbi:mediator of DNA damage checkpoint protein 1 isoform X6 [Canis lupus familiaris]|uniref:mediator of DNA damage checkpoint protein 1 isoform X6 n=1 Tax=Canis lupus familiaris TaxID=9615 RepID=UPI0018F3186E|nr:mediator of DNA damage checkpoint protein 1 isoform X6 [Canis lupus familiaris]XP_038538856.1 mediator of DNA damage checkpoint protein 1 isoform X6 [Canis lupus familiaris]